MNQNPTLTGEKLKNEIKKLRKDPIIIGMLQDLVSNGINPVEQEETDSSIMLKASKAYHELGGKQAITIGGPWQAIINLYTQSLE